MAIHIFYECSSSTLNTSLQIRIFCLVRNVFPLQEHISFDWLLYLQVYDRPLSQVI